MVEALQEDGRMNAYVTKKIAEKINYPNMNMPWQIR